MIRHLSGRVLKVLPGQAVVEAGGVGFLVNIPDSLVLVPSANVALWTHLRLREDGAELFGFLAEEELDLFEELQKVPSVGGRKALAILSQLGVEGLRRAVLDGDLARLSTAKGIGKKLAQQILLGLRGLIAVEEIPVPASRKPVLDDATLALIELGYREAEAMEKVAKVRKKHAKVTDPAELVKLALKE